MIVRCCKCHDLPKEEIDRQMASGEMDEVCPENHNCQEWNLCPCDFTEEDAAGVLGGLGFTVEKKPEN